MCKIGPFIHKPNIKVLLTLICFVSPILNVDKFLKKTVSNPRVMADSEKVIESSHVARKYFKRFSHTQNVKK